MANRCNSCSKLCALNTEEPEVDFDHEVNEDGLSVRATVRLARSSECCGDEVKEANFDSEVSIRWDEMRGADEHYDTKTGEPLSDDHELDVEEGDAELTERSEGKGRGLKSFYGFNVNFTVRCICTSAKQAETEPLYEGDLSDEMQASHFDEIN